MNPNAIIYLDGAYVPLQDAKISVLDHGVLYGDGVFEGIRAYNKRIFKLTEHIDRFFQGAKALMLDIPLSRQAVEEVVLETCRRNQIEDGYIRLVVTRGEGDLGMSPTKCKNPSLFCIADRIALYPPELYEVGIPIITAQQRRNYAATLDPQIKSLNYLNNILAKIEANHAGAQEALLLNQNGVVAECTGDNIFIIKDDTVYTPPVYIGLLNGITRRTVMTIAKEAGYPVREEEFTLFNVYNADECFLTGTGAECIPVTAVDRRVIGQGVAGPITKQLITRYQDYVRSVGAPIYTEV